MAWLFAVSYLGSLIKEIESMRGIHIAIQMKFDKDLSAYIRTNIPSCHRCEKSEHRNLTSTC